MKVLDVNVLIYAFRPEIKQYAVTRNWLQLLIDSGRPFYVPDIVLAGFVRTVTRKPFDPPNHPKEAWEFVEALTGLPQCTIACGSAAHFTAFRSLCEAIEAEGNLITDAYIAAHAIINDSEIISWDADFSKFPGLSWRTPLDPHARTNPR